MLVRVLIFGPLCDEIGGREIAVEVAEPATVSAINHALAVKHPQRAAMFRTARLAVKSAFSQPEQPVRADDEVALIEMVSGG